MSAHVLEHGSTRPGRWLRRNRVRATLWIAVVEGLLVIFHVVHWWAVVLLAAIGLAVWWWLGRRNRSDAVRHGTWILAASQLLVAMVPIVLVVATGIAIAVVALLAIAALIVLFTQRS